MPDSGDFTRRAGAFRAGRGVFESRREAESGRASSQTNFVPYYNNGGGSPDVQTDKIKLTRSGSGRDVGVIRAKSKAVNYKKPEPRAK